MISEDASHGPMCDGLAAEAPDDVRVVCVRSHYVTMTSPRRKHPTEAPDESAPAVTATRPTEAPPDDVRVVCRRSHYVTTMTSPR